MGLFIILYIVMAIIVYSLLYVFGDLDVDEDFILFLGTLFWPLLLLALGVGGLFKGLNKVLDKVKK